LIFLFFLVLLKLQMRKKIFFTLFFIIISSSFSFSQKGIKVLTIDDYIINPLTVEYIKRGLNQARDEDAILILKLDTPGGLLKSTQEIVKVLLNSPVPIVTYITPSGAKAASAGVFISYASHILAMSPSTHIGAAHPVIGGGSWGKLNDEVKDKILNDTLAWAETIANKRKRPINFLNEAIEKSISITEKEALKRKVCDLVVASLDELLQEINGRIVSTSSGEINISTKDVSIDEINLTSREKILNTIIDPNIAYLLLTLGFLGLIFEVTHPGFGFPGIAGTISLILAFYALSILPLNYAGLILIILGIIFLIVESLTPTFGMFTLGGIISLFFGSIMLFNQPMLIRVSFKVFIPLIIFLTSLTLFLLGKVLVAHRQKSKVGKEGLIGEEGIAQTDIVKKGKILIHGEIWDAVSSNPIKEGEAVSVEKIKGLKLFVKRKEE